MRGTSIFPDSNGLLSSLLLDNQLTLGGRWLRPCLGLFTVWDVPVGCQDVEVPETVRTLLLLGLK